MDILDIFLVYWVTVVLVWLNFAHTEEKYNLDIFE